MYISFFNTNSILSLKSPKTQPTPQRFGANLLPLSQDTVSFKGKNTQVIKKHDFSGIDRNTIEKHRVDISGFRSTDDLQSWATNKIKDLTEKDFCGRQEETKKQRTKLLTDWIDYVSKESNYTPVEQFNILSAITSELKDSNDKLPPVLNKEILNSTMKQVSAIFENNPLQNININKLYQNKLNSFYQSVNEKQTQNSDFTGWIIIPSKANDDSHFQENVDKLQTLSYSTWCTKSHKATPYLKDGDIHIYFEKGKPKLGISFEGETLNEIQGELNNGRIPQEYFSLIKKYIKGHNYKLSDFAKGEIHTIERRNTEIKSFKNAVGAEAIKNGDAEKIMSYFGKFAGKTADGKIILTDFCTKHKGITLKEYGVNENKMFKTISVILGDADFNSSEVSKIGSLSHIGGDAYLKNSKLTPKAFANIKVEGEIIY